MKRARTAEAKDTRRQVLLEAALDEFFDKGYSAARMDDIAKRAGLSKGAIYLYFDSKERLFRSLIETIAIPNVERVEAAAQNAGGGVNAIRAILSMAPVIVRESPVPKIVKVLIADAPAFPEMVMVYRKTVVERVLGVLAGVLKTAAEAGEIKIGDPHLTARLVAAPIVFSAIWRVVFEHGDAEKVDLVALFSLHEDMLLRALCAKEKVAA